MCSWLWQGLRIQAKTNPPVSYFMFQPDYYKRQSLIKLIFKYTIEVLLLLVSLVCMMCFENGSSGYLDT